jgi:transcriptional regulator with XRE-family HTH domain
MVDLATLRKTLHLTQSQFARLLGVHSLTISKWERAQVTRAQGMPFSSKPSPYQEALLQVFEQAAKNDPEVGLRAHGEIISRGVGQGLWELFQAAYLLRKKTS